MKRLSAFAAAGLALTVAAAAIARNPQFEGPTRTR